MSKRKATRSKSPEYLADFLFICTRTLMKHGMSEDKAIPQAMEMAEGMCKNWSKQLVYWPEYDSQDRLVRNARIFEECNGTNFDELARKYDLSVQAVYHIYKMVRQQEISKRQRLLSFD